MFTAPSQHGTDARTVYLSTSCACFVKNSTYAFCDFLNVIQPKEGYFVCFLRSKGKEDMLGSALILQRQCTCNWTTTYYKQRWCQRSLEPCAVTAMWVEGSNKSKGRQNCVIGVSVYIVTAKCVCRSLSDRSAFLQERSSGVVTDSWRNICPYHDLLKLSLPWWNSWVTDSAVRSRVEKGMALAHVAG